MCFKGALMNSSPFSYKGCPPRVWAEIDSNALVHNYTVLSQSVATRKDCASVAVVKANAYGHGVDTAVKALLRAGCRHFAVATPEEALEVRSLLDVAAPAEATLVLVLGYTPPEWVGIAADRRITLTCISRAHADALAAEAVRAGVTALCHVALDTGMNRIGLPVQAPEDVEDTVRDITHIMALDGLSVTGMFTHFALADENYEAAVAPDSHTMTQYRRYRAVYERLTALGQRPAFCHVCNSAAAIRLPPLYPDVCFDGVRFGISLYGYGVSPAPHHTFTLRPVMRLVTRVVHLHTLPAGEIVSYGGRYTAPTPRTIATLSVGYADGFRRGFEGSLVTIHTAAGDVSAPLVGRICMDQCMADVTDLPVAVGDEVTLFGGPSPAFPAPQASLEALCDKADTIPYEALCLISGRVPRIERS